jgi:hypothetical protein
MEVGRFITGTFIKECVVITGSVPELLVLYQSEPHQESAPPGT